jgi:hypothetical protein
MKISVLPSNNGLGHIRRMILLGNFLKKKNQISIYSNKKNNFFVKKGLKKINSGIEIIIKKKNYSLNFDKNLVSDLLKSDLVIVDNFIELTNKIKKIVIFANFLWHKEFKIKNIKYESIEKKIKKKNYITMGNYLFQKRYMKKFNNYLIPFFGNFKKSKKTRSILISLGTAKYYSDDFLKNKFKKFLELLSKLNCKIFLDPKIYDSKYIKFNVYKADYTQQMFNKIQVALIKPGMGTVEECLKRGIIIFSYTKKCFPEFLHNARILKKNNLGYEFKSFKFFIFMLKKILSSNSIVKLHEKRCKNLEWNGEKKVEEVIKNFFNFHMI